MYLQLVCVIDVGEKYILYLQRGDHGRGNEWLKGGGIRDVMFKTGGDIIIFLHIIITA
jgi:hypothetical protein